MKNEQANEKPVVSSEEQKNFDRLYKAIKDASGNLSLDYNQKFNFLKGSRYENTGDPQSDRTFVNSSIEKQNEIIDQYVLIHSLAKSFASNPELFKLNSKLQEAFIYEYEEGPENYKPESIEKIIVLSKELQNIYNPSLDLLCRDVFKIINTAQAVSILAKGGKFNSDELLRKEKGIFNQTLLNLGIDRSMKGTNNKDFIVAGRELQLLEYDFLDKLNFSKDKLINEVIKATAVTYDLKPEIISHVVKDSIKLSNKSPETIEEKNKISENLLNYTKCRIDSINRNLKSHSRTIPYLHNRLNPEVAIFAAAFAGVNGIINTEAALSKLDTEKSEQKKEKATQLKSKIDESLKAVKDLELNPIQVQSLKQWIMEKISQVLAAVGINLGQKQRGEQSNLEQGQKEVKYLKNAIPTGISNGTDKDVNGKSAFADQAIYRSKTNHGFER